MPPDRESSSASASARSAVSATAPIAASPARSRASRTKLPLSPAMRPGATTLTPPLAFRLRPRELAVPLAALERRRQLRNGHRLRLVRSCLLGLREHRLHRSGVALLRSKPLLRGPLRLALLEDRQQRSGDEDRRVR